MLNYYDGVLVIAYIAEYKRTPIKITLISALLDKNK